MHSLDSSLLTGILAQLTDRDQISALLCCQRWRGILEAKRSIERAAEKGDIITILHSGLYSSNKLLRIGCRYGLLYLIHFALKRGATKLNQGLYGACQGGHIPAIELMIEKGATNLNWGLYEVCREGHIPAIELMIEKGATECCCGRSIESHLQVDNPFEEIAEIFNL
jgi:hypothetical protein